jgi:HK97 family phage major capsid protein
MPQAIQDIIDQRANKVHNAREILTKAETEKRSMNPEERKQYDALMEKALDLGNEAETEKRKIQLQKEEARDLVESRNVENTEVKPELLAFRSLIRQGSLRITDQERRALSSDNATEGGILVPRIVADGFVEDLDKTVVIRNFAMIDQIDGIASLGKPSVDGDVDDFDWTTELDSGKEDSGLKFGYRELKPHPLRKRLKVSKQLLRTSTRNPEELIRRQLRKVLGYTQEKAYLLGNGAGRPLGVYIASDQGIGSSRDVNSGAATSYTFDGIRKAKYKMESSYRQGARWLTHRDSLLEISLLKDGQQRPLWSESHREDEPDRILGIPVDESEFNPNSLLEDSYGMLLANWDYYHILDSMDFEIETLHELYAEKAQVGFFVNYHGDGMPVDQKAFVRVKHKA